MEDHAWVELFKVPAVEELIETDVVLVRLLKSALVAPRSPT